MLDIIFYFVGAIVCGAAVAIGISIFYAMFIHPIFQAISMGYWYSKCVKLSGQKYNVFKCIWNYYRINGWRLSYIENDYGRWDGIFKFDFKERKNENSN